MSNTLPIQISLTLVEKSGGTTSVGLWFRRLSLLGGRHKEGKSRGTGHDPTSLKNRKGRVSDRGGCGFKYQNLKAFGGFKPWNLKAFGGVKSWDLKAFVENPVGD